MAWLYYDPRQMRVKLRKRYAVYFNGVDGYGSGTWSLRYYADEFAQSTWIVKFRPFWYNDFVYPRYHTMKVFGTGTHDMSVWYMYNKYVGFRHQYNHYIGLKVVEPATSVFFGFSCKYIARDTIEYVAVVNDDEYGGTRTSTGLIRNNTYGGYNIAYPSIWRGHYYHGCIEYVMVYTRFMSVSELKQIKENPWNPPRNGLLLWLMFEEGKGNKVYDLSGNGYHATLTGGYEWVTLP